MYISIAQSDESILIYHVNMKTIASFTVDHDILGKGMYLSGTDSIVSPVMSI